MSSKCCHHLPWTVVQGLPPKALAEQRVVCLGAGSAGMGVVTMIANGGCRTLPLRCRLALHCRTELHADALHLLAMQYLQNPPLWRCHAHSHAMFTAPPVPLPHLHC
jgi:hypothetical protein